MFYRGSSDIHPDGLQTLYLMNPSNNNPVLSYPPDTPHFNPGPSVIHAPPPQQFMGFPLDDSSTQGNHAESVIMGSKYLKAAQELLDEVVSVGKRTNSGGGQEGFTNKAKVSKESISEENAVLELTSAQRHDIQMKKSTLNSMMDEVEQRYRQYHQQMQMIVASFEQVAGTGSAKSYTSLALKTILKQFSCLKNTISTQTKALSKTLGEEEDYHMGRKMDGSRLRFVDQQQRALRQLGMMQNNNNATSWRPQRCLPERAVLLLRAWLFEHFLHPYPKDSDKQMLAKQTGLTRSQVSNWFINARVRLWKPMVEDMYLEETQSREHINPIDNIITPDVEYKDSKSSNLRPIINNHDTVQSMQNDKLTLNPSRGSNMENPSGRYSKKRRSENQENSPSSILSDNMETETGGRKIDKCVNDNITFISANQLGQSLGHYSSPSGYGSTYGISIAESDQRQQIPSSFPGNNNFSLSLAPPPSETYSQKHSFLSHGDFEFGTRIEPVGSDHRANGINQVNTSHPNLSNFEILDFQLLHDHRFVA